MLKFEGLGLGILWAEGFDSEVANASIHVTE